MSGADLRDLRAQVLCAEMGTRFRIWVVCALELS